MSAESNPRNIPIAPATSNHFNEYERTVRELEDATINFARAYMAAKDRLARAVRRLIYLRRGTR